MQWYRLGMVVVGQPIPYPPRTQLPPGVATGLVWTEAGGGVLYIEATLLPEGTGLTLTEQLGAVMQESAKDVLAAAIPALAARLAITAAA